MDSNQQFWLCFWFIVGITIATIVCVPTYIVHNHDVEMAKAGYVQKLIVTRPGNDFISPITERVWVKLSDEPTLEKK